jgi:hypothetical protein
MATSCRYCASNHPARGRFRGCKLVGGVDWNLTIHSSESSASRLDSGVMRSLFALATSVVLSCCASPGGTATTNARCGIPSSGDWSLLATPPQAESQMLAAAGISNPGTGGKLYWFGSSNGQLMLCRVPRHDPTSNSLLGRDCFSSRWIFAERNGAWQPDKDDSLTLCGNY